MELYLRWLEEYEMQPDEEPPIGLILCAAGLTWMTSTVTGPQAITISQSQPEVTTTEFTATRTPVEVGPHTMATTTWNFIIGTEFRYKLKQPDESKPELAVEITGVNIHLDLPIKVHLTEGAKATLVEHEMGHAAICKRVYASARNAAMSAAREVTGATFEGSGADVDDATAAALRKAHQEVSRMYAERTQEVVERTSNLYEHLQAKRKGSVEECVEKALRSN